MNQTHLNNQFFEQSVFAIADEYCRVNLTKDRIPGAVYKVLDNKAYNMNEQLGIPENSRLSDLISIWAKDVPEEERQMFLEFWNRETLLSRFENGENHVWIVYWSRTVDGKPMRAEDHLAMFLDEENGDIVGVNYVLDRTEHYRLKEYKEELERKNHQLDIMVKREQQYQKQLILAYEDVKRQLDIFSESIAGGMKISYDDSEFSLKYVSKQLASMLDYESPESLMEASGGSFLSLIHPKDFEESIKDAIEQYERKGSYAVILRMKCRDGSWKYVEDHGRKVMNREGEAEYWNLILDKHELIITNIELESTRQTNEAKTEFLSRMSHDIRTPLNGIIGLLDQADRHPDDLRLLASNRKKIHTAADHLLNLLNDVLELNRLSFTKTELPLKELDLNELLNDIRIGAKMRAEAKHIHLYMEERFFLKNPYVWGSETYIRQILFHVITNALKYNHPSGSVWVQVGENELDERTVELQIQVKDDGIGMSSEFLTQIFEPFSQERKDARSEYQGNGLGMTIVKNLIDRMRGSIMVSSEVEKGTVIDISIPFNLAKPHTDIDWKGDSAEDSLKGLHALLAEDNELNMEIVSYMLEDAQMTVSKAYNGKEAFEQFKNAPVGTFDVILMDIMMPVMDGLTAAAAIRSLERSDAGCIPIIAMTANAFLEDEKQCLEAGMNIHLSKPLYAEKVFSAIAQLCKKVP